MVADERICQRYSPRNAGELLWVFTYALKRSKRRLRHPFNYRELTNRLLSYPQRRDLFFFIFIILSLFCVFHVVDFKEKKTPKVAKKS